MNLGIKLAGSLREPCVPRLLLFEYILGRTRQVTHTSADHIASEFQSYYAQLYNLPHSTLPQGQTSSREQLIRDFLTKYSPPLISSKDAVALDGPFILGGAGRGALTHAAR